MAGGIEADCRIEALITTVRSMYASGLMPAPSSSAISACRSRVRFVFGALSATVLTDARRIRDRPLLFHRYF